MLHRLMAAILACFLTIFFIVQIAAAKIITANSCSQPDTQLAIDSAVDGDIVEIPSGRCSWNNSVRVSKGITIIGAGINRSIITDTRRSPQTWGLFRVDSDANENTRISGIEFDGRNNKQISVTGYGGPDGLKKFRIDHCKFTFSHNQTILISGQYGIIDSCIFEGNPDDGIIFIRHGVGRWCEPNDFGTDKFVFIEDNQFNLNTNGAGDTVDSGDGARWVFRYNTVYNADVEAHGCDSEYSGVRAYEVYNNNWIFENGGGKNGRVMNFRGGTGVIYNNTVTLEPQHRISQFIALNTYRITTAYSRCRASADRCSGGEGYPCYDQIGRGRGSGSNCAINQEFDPVYIWNNDCAGSNCPSSDVYVSGAVSGYIDANDDYYLNAGAKPGYSAFSYPYPLRVQSGNPLPSAPTNLRIISSLE